jgi:hypothetical protein
VGNWCLNDEDQVSIEPTPNASISIGTQPLDERQTEVGPSEAQGGSSRT